MEVVDFHIFSPGVDPNQPGGMKQFHAEHEHVLDAHFGKRLTLGLGEMGEAAVQVGDSPGTMPAIKTAPERAEHPGRLKIQVDGKPKDYHGRDAQAEISEAVN